MRPLYIHFIQTMHTVLRGITIWTFYTLVSCESIACRSTWNRLRSGLIFDPAEPDMSDERILGRYLSNRPRRQQQAFGDFPPEAVVAASVRDSRNAAATAADPMCDCTLDHEPVELSDDHYPNLLPAVTCHGGQWCKKFVYPVLVLTNKTDDGATGDTMAYTREGLPEELVVRNWRFVRIDVTVACSCRN